MYPEKQAYMLHAEGSYMIARHSRRRRFLGLGWQARGRGYFPEPKGPRLFRARRVDGTEVASPIAFGPDPGPSLSIDLPDGRHA
jgi:hypothetical protein